MIRTKPESCLGCACHDHGSDFSQIEGTGANRVLIVGEASGEQEQRDQLPFRPYARAGSILERCLRRMSLSRESFSITNVLRCRPRKNWLANAPWEWSSIAQCRPNLEAAIRERQPAAILALGGIATRELTGLSGKYLGVLHLSGYVLPHFQGIPVIPAYHPAYIGRGKADHQGVFSRIINRAVNIARGTDKAWLWGVDPQQPGTWPGLRYTLHPSLDAAFAFVHFIEANTSLPIAMDIETKESLDLDEDAREGYTDTEIQLVQFSTGKGHGIAFPWAGPFKELALRVFNSGNPKYGHNWNLFDHKVIRTVAAREGLHYAPRGMLFDTLDMFHHWQPDLAANLQAACQFIQAPFPWKHLAGTAIEFYGCCDVDNDWQLGEMLQATLKRDGLWGDHERGYLGMVYELRPVLSGMEDRGVPIDDAARVRLGEAFDKAQRALGEELDGMVPDSCRKVEPKEGLKQFPKDVRLFFEEQGVIVPKGEQLLDNETQTIALRARLLERAFFDKDGKKYHYEVRDFMVPHMNDQGELTTRKAARWCRVFAFNPNSQDAVFAYMDTQGHQRPKNKHGQQDEDGNDPDTTAAKELARLARKTGDNFYLKVTEYRGYTKMKSTYVAGFQPREDGRVHPAITFDTAIGQTSSRNPNAHNFPKLKPTYELAQEMRGMICAPPGYEISEWDYKSCHALTLGFLAEDPDYMRLTRLDVHSFVAGHFLGCWDGFKIIGESDDELRERFRWLKSDQARKHVRDDQAKHAILGIGNGLRAKGLYDRYMENFVLDACPDCKLPARWPRPYPKRKPVCRLCGDTGHPSGLKIAERFLTLLEKLFPKVFRYQEEERQRAHRDMKLLSPTLFIRRFYEVFRWDGKKSDWGHGDQAEQAVAFRHPNIAFCHIRRALKNLGAAGLDSRYGLFNNIHDSFMFCYPQELREQHVRDVYPVLVAPNPTLVNSTAPQGLVIGVEASAGERWNAMEEIKLPKLVL
jgi:uracil-DNA glycosylase family 4